MAHSAMIAACGHARSSSWSIDSLPPNFSEVTPLRIVLLGKSVSENSRVGNFILGRAAFDSEASPGIIERLRGRLKDRHVIIIKSPQLLQTNISHHQITQTVRDCVNLSDPGPHVFIVTLQHNDFTEEELRRVKIVLKEFSDEAIKRTIVITTNEETHDANELIQELNTECGGGHLQLDHKNEECPALSPDEQDVRRCFHQSCPEPHALLLVFKSGTFTEQDRDALKLINLIFGEGSSEYVIVVFMHEEQEYVSIKDSDTELVKSLLQTNRHLHYHLQKNGDLLQVQKLLESIEKMVEEKGGHQLKIPEHPIPFWMKEATVCQTTNKIHKASAGAEKSLECVRIVLIGKTGVGEECNWKTPSWHVTCFSQGPV
ncbi:hypothetical protein QQF64_034645 [Cirrhinus molitorella]|uniref:AIG1-type G domain-containing protein n=1 Tax=Cirrhinus molitorella TaxID=172907 RepID=A0ABR3L340_9TELE